MLESDAHVKDASNDSEDGCECLAVVGGRFAHGLVYSWKDPLLRQGTNQMRPAFGLPTQSTHCHTTCSSLCTDMSFNDDAYADRIWQLRKRAFLISLVHEV